MTSEFHIRLDTWDDNILEKVLKDISPKYYVYGKEIANKTQKEHTHIHVYKDLTIQPASFAKHVRQSILQKYFPKDSRQYTVTQARNSKKSQLYTMKDHDYTFSKDYPEHLKDNLLSKLKQLDDEKNTPFKEQLYNIFKNKISSNNNESSDLPGYMYPAEVDGTVSNSMYKDIIANRVERDLLPPSHADTIKYMKYVTLKLEQNNEIHPADLSTLNHHLFTPFR